jgi:DNA-binding GntR family transcriptional regulator
LLEQIVRTSAEEIRQEIAARIIGGALRPGAVLDETQLAAEFAVSRTPIREALRQLVASGLVEQRAHMPASVSKPDEDTLAGMFEVMGYLEALCAGLCAIVMTAQERRDLDIIHNDMGAIVRSADCAQYQRANVAFHSAIYSGSHNAYLAEITAKTRERVQPFRNAQFDNSGRLAKSHYEHGLIVDMILRGDQAGAEAQMRRHIAIVEFAYQQLAHACQD